MHCKAKLHLCIVTTRLQLMKQFLQCGGSGREGVRRKASKCTCGGLDADQLLKRFSLAAPTSPTPIQALYSSDMHTWRWKESIDVWCRPTRIPLDTRTSISLSLLVSLSNLNLKQPITFLSQCHTIQLS